MVKATKSGVPDAFSVYDSGGLRVAEYVNDVWRFMIYDIGGKLIAEYGGLQSTDEGGVKYVFQDWQGSTRAVVGNTGNVQSRSDYTAFGETIGSGTGLRESGFGKSGNLRQGYAPTEKDEATGLDHTWFRKIENQAGRWTSPDPYNPSMSLGDPQSFNRYSYVSNQPTNFVDPSGLLRIQECTRNWWTDSNGNRVYSSFQCVTIYDDGGGTGNGGGGIGGGGGGGQEAGLSDCVKSLLQKFFPNLNLDSIRVHLGLPRWAPSTTTSGGKVGGITVGNTVYTSSQINFESHLGATWEALKFIAHEITHSDQYRRLGIVGFGIGYAIEGTFQAMIAPASRAIAASYDANAFENRATVNASRIIRQLRREGSNPCIVDFGNILTVTVNG